MLTRYSLLLVGLFQNLPIQAYNNDIDDTTQSSETFIDLYERGVQSYLSNEFENCIYFLENAVGKYKHYYETTANCRIECDYATRANKNKAEFIHSNDIENLHFYELIIKQTLCLTKCRKQNSNYLPFDEDFDGYYLDLFKNRQAYAYLHSCYTKVDQVTLAASAALTYMVKHPADTVMQKNFELGLEKPGVDKEAIVDLDEKKFVPIFVAGILAVNEKEWTKAISLMENSVMQFIYDENQCRAYCEGEFDHGFLPDFISAIGNHFTNTLYCKRNCTREMGMVRGKYYIKLFAEHYQYLQQAYYEDVKYEAAYRAGLSYLRFNEGDQDMLNKLKLIEKQIKGHLNENFFKVRREAVEYYERNSYEEKLVSFIKTAFVELDEHAEEVTMEQPSDNSTDDIDNGGDSETKVDEHLVNEGIIYQIPTSGYHKDEL
ncbi:cartilage-associated protein-like isoform X3 [Topomyia yanbarensis]|uniref:cartilage-associated protein-like isoform X3 n=1 Tax=Topomyia yanbarensis TaxID=2498891 RepID=UPI00273C8CF3|nr:cartilage-associated protein-like isoform X3 [Topomyia yanbarensis]